MKTTIELPDIMFRQARTLARRHGLAVLSNDGYFDSTRGGQAHRLLTGSRIMGAGGSNG